MGLLDDISKLTTPAAELPDLEDDNFDESSKVKLKPQRVNRNSNFDFEKDAKYAGKAISRAELFGNISEISGLQKKTSDSDFESDAEDEDEENEVSEDESEAVDSDAIQVDSEEGEDVDDEEDTESEGGENEDEEEGDVAENLKMKLMSIRDDSEDKTAEKAEAVRNQKQVWDDLMYANIRMHALLNSVNQMPRGEMRKQLVKSSDEKTMTSLQNALTNMAKLRNSLQKATDCFGKNSEEVEEDDDEEIPSDDEIIPSDDEEVEDEDQEEPEEEPEETKTSTGTSLKTLKKNLEKRDAAIDKFRGTTITKWYNRTKLLSSKSTDFSVFEKGSILGQIQKVLADEDKLLKKVRTNRSGVPRVGSASSTDVIDNEIFDDSDFYQVLLKQMLEARSQNSHQDGADMTRSYMELQTMFNQKKKRDMSQLSSKDRRLKYEPIAKLINFYPSKPSVVTWSHESRNELFKSLFT